MTYSCCHVASWCCYAVAILAGPGVPAFTFCCGLTLTSSKLLSVLNLNVRLVRGADMLVMLHSLRGGAVQTCASVRLPVDAINEAGPWSSVAYLTYMINNVVTRAPSALGSFFG